MKNLFFFFLYIIAPRLLFCFPAVMWIRSSFPAVHRTVWDFSSSPKAFLYYIGLFLISISFAISEIKTYDRVKTKKIKKTITAIGIIAGLCFMVAEGVISAYSDTVILYSPVFPVICLLFCSLLVVLFWLMRRYLIILENNNFLNNCLFKWHKEWKDNVLHVDNNIYMGKFSFILWFSLYTASIVLVCTYGGRTWGAIVGLLVSYGSLIALTRQFGGGLGPSHPWYPPYWRMLSSINMVFFSFGYWFTHQIFYPFLRTYLHENVPYLVLDYLPTLHEFILFSSMMLPVYVRPEFTNTLVQDCERKGEGI